MIDHQRVEGWPELQVVEHRVPAEEMVARCQKYVGAASLPLACAEFKLAARRCDIWLERLCAARRRRARALHCAGYDHVGSTNMKRAFSKRIRARASPRLQPARPHGGRHRRVRKRNT